MTARLPMTLQRYPRRDGVYNLLPDSVVVHDRYQNRVMQLDSFTAEIWLRIDGLTTLAEIALDIAVQLALPVDEVSLSAAAIVGMLGIEGVVYLGLEPEPLPYHLRLPLDQQDPALAAQSMRAAGWL